MYVSGERQNLCDFSHSGWVGYWNNTLPRLLTVENQITCLTDFLSIDNLCLCVSPWLVPLATTCSLQCWENGCENSGPSVHRQRWEVEFNGILPYISSPGQQCCFDSLGQWYSALKAVVGGTKPGYACRCWGIGAHLGPAALGHCVRHRIVGLAPPNILAYTNSDRYVKGISSYYLPFFKNANSCYQ